MGYLIDETVGSNLKALRLNCNFTQEALAARAGVSKQTISNLEKGFGGSSKTIERIADCLNVSPLEFYREAPINTDIQFKRVSAKMAALDMGKYAFELQRTINFIINDAKEQLYFSVVMSTIKETFKQNEYELLLDLDAKLGDKSHRVLSAFCEELISSIKHFLFTTETNEGNEIDDILKE